MALSVLIDTNILVYTYDNKAPYKKAKALDTLKLLRQAGRGYLSVKTLSEYFYVVTRRDPLLTPAQAILDLEYYMVAFPILDLTPQIVIEAARGVRDHSFSYWDAQMWATAKIHRLDAVFSEDMAVGSVIGGVSLINPLDPAFDLVAWLGDDENGVSRQA